jgi:hypothetical protein
MKYVDATTYTLLSRIQVEERLVANALEAKVPEDHILRLLPLMLEDPEAVDECANALIVH